MLVKTISSKCSYFGVLLIVFVIFGFNYSFSRNTDYGSEYYGEGEYGQINDNIKVDISTGKDKIEPSKVNFNCKVNGGNKPYDFSRDFGNGDTKYINNVYDNNVQETKTYINEGKFKVKCIVEDNYGRKNKEEVSVNISKDLKENTYISGINFNFSGKNYSFEKRKSSFVLIDGENDELITLSPFSCNKQDCENRKQKFEKLNFDTVSLDNGIKLYDIPETQQKVFFTNKWGYYVKSDNLERTKQLLNNAQLEGEEDSNNIENTNKSNQNEEKNLGGGGGGRIYKDDEYEEKEKNKNEATKLDGKYNKTKLSKSTLRKLSEYTTTSLDNDQKNKIKDLVNKFTNIFENKVLKGKTNTEKRKLISNKQDKIKNMISKINNNRGLSENKKATIIGFLLEVSHKMNSISNTSSIYTSVYHQGGDSLEDEKDFTEQKETDLTKKKKELEQKKKEREKKLKNAKEELEKIKEAEQELRNKKEELEKAVNEIESGEKDATTLDDDTAVYEGNLEKFKNELKEINKKLRKLKKRKKELKEEISFQETQIEQEEKIIDGLEKEIKKTRSKNKEIEEKIKEKKKRQRKKAKNSKKER